MRTKTRSSISNTVCLLCLPGESTPPAVATPSANCTAISYGRRVRTPTEESTFQGKTRTNFYSSE